MWAAVSAFLAAFLMAFGGLDLRMRHCSVCALGDFGLVTAQASIWSQGCPDLRPCVGGLLWWTEPLFSDDVFRYVWEGQVTSNGGNPISTHPLNFIPLNLRSILRSITLIFQAFIHQWPCIGLQWLRAFLRLCLS